MQSSIFKLLCLIVFSFVVMSEPPEKIDVVSMTPIDAVNTTGRVYVMRA